MTDETAEASIPSEYWLERLADAERSQKNYHEVCDNIDTLLSDLERLNKSTKDREMQIFWANMEVMKPTIYAREPVPIVGSRFNDRRDLPRRAGEILERALSADNEADDLHDTLKLIRDDLCVNARGVPWLKMKERDGGEYACTDHLDRQDFRHEVARKWREVTWVSRRSWNTKEECVARFKGTASPTALEQLVFEKQDFGKGQEKHGEKKAQIWEVWDKTKKQVIWVSEGVEELLDTKAAADVLGDLKDFFPCPRPAFGSLQRGTLIPVPDFVYYKGQIEEINELTARIAALTDSLRVRGFYPAGNADVAEALETAMKNMDDRAVLVPVSSMAALGTTSLKDAIVWLPIDVVAQVIQVLVEQRRIMIDDVYQITGLSDIMRGATDPDETLGAQQMKGQYGAVRVRERQAEMVRLARDVTRMKAEIMAEQVPIDQLLMMAQVDDLPRQADIEQQKQQLMQQAQQALLQLVQQASQPQQPGAGAPGAPPNPGSMPPQGPPQAPMQ